MFSGADPQRENFEPLFFREQDEEESCEKKSEDEEEDEGYIPGTTPVNMAASAQVERVSACPLCLEHSRFMHVCVCRFWTF